MRALVGLFACVVGCDPAASEPPSQCTAYVQSGGQFAVGSATVAGDTLRVMLLRESFGGGVLAGASITGVTGASGGSASAGGETIEVLIDLGRSGDGGASTVDGGVEIGTFTLLAYLTEPGRPDCEVIRTFHFSDDKNGVVQVT